MNQAWQKARSRSGTEQRRGQQKRYLARNGAGQSRVESAERSLTYGRLDSQGTPRTVSSVHELFVAVTCGRYASVVMG
jgi:hypothetical protein